MASPKLRSFTLRVNRDPYLLDLWSVRRQVYEVPEKKVVGEREQWAGTILVLDHNGHLPTQKLYCLEFVHRRWLLGVSHTAAALIQRLQATCKAVAKAV